MVLSARAAALFASCLLLAACSGEAGKGKGKGGDDAGMDGSVSGDGNSGDGNSGDGNSGDGNSGDGNSGDGNSGDGNSGDGNSGDGNSGDGDGGTPNPTDGGGAPYPINDAGQVLCGTGPCQCSDGLDNDDDGLDDLADPECVSTWDNDEGSFATGISGDNRDDACQDCFFDGNSGSGNDGCRLPTSCLETGLPTSGGGSCDSCEQTNQCLTFCKAYTPNGCDCFGCCTIQVGGEDVSVLLEPGCDINGSDVTGCTECKPNVNCVNTCGECELCPGKTIDDLPDHCGNPSGGSDGGTSGGDGGSTTPTPTCEDGQACGAGLPGCPSGSSCQFGCCVLIPIF